MTEYIRSIQHSPGFNWFSVDCYYYYPCTTDYSIVGTIDQRPNYLHQAIIVGRQWGLKLIYNIFFRVKTYFLIFFLFFCNYDSRNQHPLWFFLTSNQTVQTLSSLLKPDQMLPSFWAKPFLTAWGQKFFLVLYNLKLSNIIALWVLLLCSFSPLWTIYSLTQTAEWAWFSSCKKTINNINRM